MACAASARGKQCAFIHGLSPILSTAHLTQSTSPWEKRLMRRGGRLAQAANRAAGKKRTASRAAASITAASRKYFRCLVLSFIAVRWDRLDARAEQDLREWTGVAADNFPTQNESLP
jgi:hypothetical protein